MQDICVLRYTIDVLSPKYMSIVQMIASEKITDENKDQIKLEVKKKIAVLETKVMEYMFITVKVNCNDCKFDLQVNVSTTSTAKLAKTISEVCKIFRVINLT